jgi:hypothetical protein
MRRYFFIFALVGTLPTQMGAQETNICGPRAFVVERLAEEYGEQARALGLDNNNGMVEVFANIESGSWTITVTNARGMTCLVASGQAFEADLQIATRPDSDI